MKKLMLIVNPYSGRGLSKNALGVIVSLFCDEGYAVTVYTTRCGEPENLARENGGNYDMVVCVGGDGTVSGVVNGLMQILSPPPFSFIPTGTSNDMASTLALSRDPATAVRSVINGQPVPLDIGCLGDKYFTYIAAFGAFTGVSYSTPQSAKRALGHLAYVIGGLASMSAIKPQHTVITYDGGTLEGDYIFGGVTNSTKIAGFVRLDCREVDLGDGLFEVILVKNPVNTVELGTIISSILNQTYHSENVQLLHTRKIRFTFDEDVVWTRDGEFGGAHRELEIENRRHALRIIV
ncbi:lipid kinase, YegS/Rv2252/BmrU family [Sporobacter termitidis DSM 10068]|uniref:Lipid kinase, YegS/Rv2252/BmrU family n=1 Tax=Sporobacter termitidis DSM 10068 TaxID=1123282 RepID=A0A1M5YF61_9FIRM|nr:YegS/Rv2252/BmrU family lipid kinase [Sporobacter termitidis]SHI10675.1 lipid kinase, YegS/Rv2252/BmrU family [Sporobacter termitidis DSM 10068]